MRTKQQAKQQIKQQQVRIVWPAAWLVVFCCAPFFSGLLDRIPLFAALLVMLALIMRQCQKEGLIKTPWIFCIGGMFVWSIIQCFYATNKFEAICAVAMWLLILLMVQAATLWFGDVPQDAEQRIWSYYLLLFLIGVALAIWNLGGAFVTLVQGRAVLFQMGIPYENALAAFLFVAGMAGCCVLSQTRRQDMKFPYLCAGMALIAAAFVWIGSRMMLVMGGALIVLWLVTRLLRRRKRAKRVCLAIAIVLIITCVCALSSSVVRDALQQAILSQTELNERFAYYHDSIHILAQHPLGLGPGGWSSRQAEFQSAIYMVRYAHSAPVQAAVGGGYVSLAFYCAMIVASLVASLRTLGQRKNLRLLYAMNLVLFLHALLDFDFSIPFLLILFCVNQSILLCQDKPLRIVTVSKWGRVGVAVVCVVTACCSVCLLIGQGYLNAGLNHYHKQQYSAAQAAFAKGHALSPLCADIQYARGMASRKQFEGTEQLALANTAANYFDDALRLDEYNPKYHEALAKMYAGMGEHKKSAQQYDRLITLQPLVYNHYINLEESLTLAQTANLADEELMVQLQEKIQSIPMRIEQAKQRYSFWTYRVQHVPEF